jgi:parallel beta-helix repeat protein
MAIPVYYGVFNVTEGMPAQGIDGLYCDGTHAGDNVTNLNKMLAQLLTATGPTLGQGGTLEFPSAGTYAFSGSILIGQDASGHTRSYAIILQGDGQGSASSPLLQMTASSGGDLFQVSNNDGTNNDNMGGVTFRDLQIAYESASSGAAIHVESSLNVRVLHCVFQNCPVAIYLEDCGNTAIIDCTVFGTATGNGFVLGDNNTDTEVVETYIAGCVLDSFNTTPAGVAIQINNVEHVRCVNTRIETFNQGIVVSPGGSGNSARKLYFGNVSCFPLSKAGQTTGAAVLIQPINSASVVEVWFDCCELDAPDKPIAYTGGGVVLDPVNGTGGGFIDQIRFTGCHVCKWNGPGLQVIGGTVATPILTNLEILGGYYSLNGANPASGLPSAGIAIGGSPSGIRISNAACNNSVYFTGGFLTPTQDYGISIAATAQNVFARGCDLRGNLTQAVAPVSSATNVQITDCAGYNDQNATVAASAPTSSETAASQGYNGPSLVTFSNAALAVTVTLGTTAYTMSFGSIPLLPYDTIKFSAAPAVFKWLGK